MREIDWHVAFVGSQFAPKQSDPRVIPVGSVATDAEGEISMATPDLAA